MKCNFCEGQIPLKEGGGALVLVRSNANTKGVGVAVFSADGFDPEAVRKHGVCGSHCATLKFNEELDEKFGEPDTKEPEPVECPQCHNDMPPSEGTVCATCREENLEGAHMDCGRNSATDAPSGPAGCVMNGGACEGGSSG